MRVDIMKQAEHLLLTLIGVTAQQERPFLVDACKCMKLKAVVFELGKHSRLRVDDGHMIILMVGVSLQFKSVHEHTRFLLVC